MGARKGEVFVMDDDALIREALSVVLGEEGYDVICFADGAALLSAARARMPACIFLETGISDRSGLDLLRRLRAENYPAPVFIVSGEGDIPLAVDAIKSGASDFLEKPLSRAEIIARVKAAGERLSRSGAADESSRMLSLHLPGSEPLTRREREVLAQLAEGASNKEAAQRLGLSSRTIEGYRANIMRKIGVRNAAELVRRVLS